MQLQSELDYFSALLFHTHQGTLQLREDGDCSIILEDKSKLKLDKSLIYIVKEEGEARAYDIEYIDNQDVPCNFSFNVVDDVYVLSISAPPLAGRENTSIFIIHYGSITEVIGD